MKIRTTAILLAALIFSIQIVAAQPDAITLGVLGTYETNSYVLGDDDLPSAEIAAYDSLNHRVYVVNSFGDGEGSRIDVLDISDPANPTLLFTVPIAEYGGLANSVTVHGDVVAVAIEAEPKQEPGHVLFLNPEGEITQTVTVGALPDMLTFTPDGSKVLVANEGEPNTEYTVDPVGSISIIDTSDFTVTELGFEDFNEGGSRASELPEGIRIFGPGASVAQDLEPEFIAVSDDSSTAFVGLQENNAIAVVDLLNPAITSIFALGTKDHSLDENALDASNEDGAINIQSWPVHGYYLPDGIAYYEVDGTGYIVTANEGDSRDYDAFGEEERVGDVTLDPDAFPNAEELQAEANLGRLKITATSGDVDGDGDYDELFSFGGRSFSIWTVDGDLVFDSGNALEMITSERLPDEFNSSDDENPSFDDRSDDKGPEPEAVVIGRIGDQTYAFIGLERVGGIMIYNVTDPAGPVFVDYVNNRNFASDIEAGEAGDLAPEGLVFVNAQDSPTGTPLLISANETSGTTTVFEVTN